MISLGCKTTSVRLSMKSLSVCKRLHLSQNARCQLSWTDSHLQTIHHTNQTTRIVITIKLQACSLKWKTRVRATALSCYAISVTCIPCTTWVKLLWIWLCWHLDHGSQTAWGVIEHWSHKAFCWHLYLTSLVGRPQSASLIALTLSWQKFLVTSWQIILVTSVNGSIPKGCVHGINLAKKIVLRFERLQDNDLFVVLGAELCGWSRAWRRLPTVADVWS